MLVIRFIQRLQAVLHGSICREWIRVGLLWLAAQILRLWECRVFLMFQTAIQKRSFDYFQCIVRPILLDNCVLISAMKKLLIGCIFLLTACQPATPTPVAALFPTGTLAPSPIPVTDTPVPTATLEPTPTPFPPFFTHEFDASLAGWVILQAGSDSVPKITSENSRLLLQMDSPYTWLYVIYGPQDYASVRITTKFVNNALSPASMGLICHYSEVDGWLEYNVSTDGRYNVLYGKWLANGIADYRPVLDGSSNEIEQSGTEQQIGLVCSEGTMSLYINETLIRNVDVSRYVLAEGKVGVTASSFENTPVIASFDWVTISEP